MPLTHARYLQLISARLREPKQFTSADAALVFEFEREAPELCPRCGAKAWSAFTPVRVVHDVANCKGKKPNLNHG